MRYYFCYCKYPAPKYMLGVVRNHTYDYNWARRFGQFPYNANNGGFVDKEQYRLLQSKIKAGTLGIHEAMKVKLQYD